jgi:5-methylthioadenosine/S-adenosylhomocysteine deaminase
VAIYIKSASFVVRSADRVEHDRDILMEGNEIRAIGRMDPPPGCVVIDGRGKAVIPGLVNAHTHLYQSFLKGMQDDVPLVEWCNEVLYPVADVIHQDHWHKGDETVAYYWTLFGAMEMIKGGTTACINMDMSMDAVFRAWIDIGFRGVGAITLSDMWIPPKLRRDPEVSRQDALGYAERWHNYPPDDSLLKVMLAPSTPFLASRELLLWAKEQAKALGIRLQIHVAETRYEVERILSETGMTPVAYLDSLGLIDESFVAVHCVHLTEADIAILAARRPTIVHNPKSNMKLGSGVSPVPRLLAAGLSVALASDGAASNDLLDMFEEMRAAALLHKVAAEDAKAISAKQVFRMATEWGARACGINAGTLDEGKLADVAVVNLQAPHLLPMHNIVNALVYCAKASDVEATIINGKVVMQERRITTIDEAEVLRRGTEVGQDLCRRSRSSELYRPRASQQTNGEEHSVNGG